MIDMVGNTYIYIVQCDDEATSSSMSQMLADPVSRIFNLNPDAKSIHEAIEGNGGGRHRVQFQKISLHEALTSGPHVGAEVSVTDMSIGGETYDVFYRTEFFITDRANWTKLFSC